MQRKPLALWVGPSIGIVGLLSYFFYFVRFPLFRDTAWLNLMLVSAGLGFSLRALLQRNKAGSSRGSRFMGVAALLLSGLSAGLLFVYVFGLSYQMPAAQAETLQLQQVPSISLVDQHGKAFDLGEFNGRGKVITFYRGHW